MKLRQYFFGYLFVRFAKLLAALALLGTAGNMLKTFLEYEYAAQGVRYHTSNSLGMEIDQVRDELQFARQEVGRLADVQGVTLPDLDAPGDGSAQLDRLVGQLRAADGMSRELKTRLIADFEARISELRERIGRFIAQTETARAAAQPVAASSAPAVHKVPPAPPPPALTTAHPRTVFEDSGRAQNLHQDLEGVGRFLDDLSSHAEKEENRQLIAQARSSLASLEHWLPVDLAAPPRREGTPANFAPPDSGAERSSEKRPPPDPLTTAIENLNRLASGLATVREQITRGWTLDSRLREAMSSAEREANLCRGAELALAGIRLVHFYQLAKAIAAGLAIAFLILVFADFIQSFFDTATNSAAIRKRLEEGQP